MNHHDTRTRAGLALFAALTLLGTWVVASALRVVEWAVAPPPLGTTLFTTVLLYTVTMGWQPIVATWIVRRWIDPPDRLDLGLRPSTSGFGVVAVVGSLLAVVAAAALAGLLEHVGLGPVSTSLHGTAERELASSSLEGARGLGLAGAFVATVLLVWLQAFGEEVGWRGYFMFRVMVTFGPWRGLLLQALVWGLWYAPVLFFTMYGQLEVLGVVGRCLASVVTCVLWGLLFGWLRLASRSLMPVVLANTVLTLATGLPYVLYGLDAGHRSAILLPPGWLVLVPVLGVLLVSRWRSVVAIDAASAPLEAPAGALHVVIVERPLDPPRGERGDYDLN
jgi:membrane protease YdiL (CAAX protease family)